MSESSGSSSPSSRLLEKEPSNVIVLSEEVRVKTDEMLGFEDAFKVLSSLDLTKLRV